MTKTIPLDKTNGFENITGNEENHLAKSHIPSFSISLQVLKLCKDPEIKSINLNGSTIIVFLTKQIVDLIDI